MRVAVDARTVYSRTRRGTGKNLVDLYRRMAQLRPHWSFLMFHRDPGTVDDPFADVPNVQGQLIEMPGDRWNLWEQIRLPVAARAARADVLHSPANTGPGRPWLPLVVTIHDLIPLDVRGESDAARRWERSVGRAARAARRILTPSRFTSERIAAHFAVPADRIVVNHWAPDSACRRVEAPSVLDQARVRYGLREGQPYLLAFGAADPRKNTRRIIEAWAGLDAAIRDRTALLIVGLQGPILEELRGWLRTLVPGEHWSLAGFAAESDLAALISGAEALVYPSLSEGFGLPVLDAFACDTPVITSRTTSLPEVAGDAAVLVDPTSIDEIRNALRDIATQPDLAATLRALGKVRLAQFSWDRCASTAADVLAEAA